MTIPTIAGRRFSVGKYEIVATPIARSAHMLRYTVFLDGKRATLADLKPGMWVTPKLVRDRAQVTMIVATAVRHPAQGPH